MHPTNDRYVFINSYQEMNGHNGSVTEKEKCLSDSENTREYPHNSEIQDDNIVSKSCLMSSNSEENMDSSLKETKNENSVTGSLIKMYYTSNVPFKQSEIAHQDSIEAIPKAIIERSTLPNLIPPLADKLPFLNDIMSLLDKRTTEITSSPRTDSHDEKLDLSTPEHSTLYTKPQETTETHPCNDTNQKFLESSPIKRVHTLETQLNTESDYNVLDETLPPTPCIGMYIPNHDDSNPILNHDKNYIYDNTSFSFNHQSYPIGPPIYNDPSLITTPYYFTYNNYDVNNSLMVNNMNPKIFKKTNGSCDAVIMTPRPKYAKSVDSSISTLKYQSGEETDDPFGNIDDFQMLKEYEFSNRNNTTAEMAKDQHGSRLIQHRIEHSTADQLSTMVDELVDDVNNLVILVGDVFGNYVIQKILDFGSNEHRITLVSKIGGHILNLAVQMYGCRVIQKAIECGNPEIQNLIIFELRGHVLDCIKDQNGNHVIQKCIERISPLQLEFMIEEISNHVVELSTHSYGCRVIQRILEHFTDEQKFRVTSEIYYQVSSLILDQYGNYVVQHILDHCAHSSHRQFVFDYICDNLFQLSSHKFASNVVEKSLVSGHAEERKIVMMEIFRHSIGLEDDMIYKMMKDPFANYVIQKMIDVIVKEKQHDLFDELVAKIKPHYPSLRKITYGKHIINKLEKLCTKLSRASISKSDSFEHHHASSKTAPNGANSRVWKTSEYTDISLKTQNHVICDSLAEFPSLVGGNKMPIISD